ncbi:MAG: hypothetical protein GQ578_05875 [Desulfuromonadaceae bacterium]|nr:hypothetical protein [Desulfuromonadaceae bacterium]
MSVPSAADITNMGFGYQMFGRESASDLNLSIKAMIAEHGALLSGRIGATAYASTTEPTSTYVKRAIKSLVAADLCQIRINRLAQEVKLEDGTDATKMRRQRKDYLDEAELMINKIEATASNSNDFAVGTVITSHFDEDA